MNRIFCFLLLAISVSGCVRHSGDGAGFITVNEKGRFIRDGQPYYYIGTNFWYGAILGSPGEGGDRERLLAELDLMKSKGIDNLRILVGADGLPGVVAKVEPTLQTAPGVYNDEILDGLDFLMAEMGKRGMLAVLYLNNSWEWSGGYSQYLEWTGHGPAPIPAVDGWDAFSTYVRDYAGCEECHELFHNHIRYILSRTNRYTGKPYIEDPAIMAWQIGNEPRAFSPENKEGFALWIHEAAALIKSIDPNHLVSVGSEGYQGCEGDIDLWERIHSYEEVDYATIHIWPYNWGWAPKDMLVERLDYSIEQTAAYIDQHLGICRSYSMPLAVEEFGFPRDGFEFARGSSVECRDLYFRSVFERIDADHKTGGMFAGCNFWAWGGLARQNPDHIFWEKGDDYMGDPAQEEQGLYSIFSDDTTVELAEEFNRRIGNLK